jgi:hypothetical protein
LPGVSCCGSQSIKRNGGACIIFTKTAWRNHNLEFHTATLIVPAKTDRVRRHGHNLQVCRLTLRERDCHKERDQRKYFCSEFQILGAIKLRKKIAVKGSFSLELPHSIVDKSECQPSTNERKI